MEFKEDINFLHEIKSIPSDLKAKSTHSIILPQPKLANVSNEGSPKTDTELEIKTSVIPQFFFSTEFKLFAHYAAEMLIEEDNA